MQSDLPENAADLLVKALAYDHIGDVYNAVKLYKRVICLAPEEVTPYERLVQIYKSRGEWKSVLHYAKKAVSLDAGLQQTWWDMGIAASALGKGRIARNVWQKFGTTLRRGKLIALQLSFNGCFEIVFAHILDPTRAILCSIPHPETGLRYRDILLFDREIVGYCLQKQQKMPVFPVLWRQRQSFFQTFCCTLENCSEEALLVLGRLCDDAEIGWEVWSDALWTSSAISSTKTPEYFGREVLREEGRGSVCVALAAKREDEVQAVLQNWVLITLGSYTDFRVF